MFKKIVLLLVIGIVLFTATPKSAVAFVDHATAKYCQATVDQLLEDFSIVGTMYYKADDSYFSPERGGFLTHYDAKRKMNWIRSIGSDAMTSFHYMPTDTTKQDCYDLATEWWNKFEPVLHWVQSRDPNRCKKYAYYRNINDCF